MTSNRESFVPALGFERLTSLYDPVVRATTREKTFKRRLLDQAAIQPGHRVVLRPGGELHLADWGPAPDPLARALFVVVQLFEGFEQTGDNVAGRLPSILEAGGLSSVREHARLRATFGSLSLYSAQRNPE